MLPDEKKDLMLIKSWDKRPDQWVIDVIVGVLVVVTIVTILLTVFMALPVLEYIMRWFGNEVYLPWSNYWEYQ